MYYYSETAVHVPAIMMSSCLFSSMALGNQNGEPHLKISPANNGEQKNGDDHYSQNGEPWDKGFTINILLLHGERFYSDIAHSLNCNLKDYLHTANNGLFNQVYVRAIGEWLREENFSN